MSETLARPTLSGETRQCACGGWTRFVVCQYCGTTDPAVAAAGWVSSSPLTVPTAFDPAAVPPPAMTPQLPPPVPAPMTAQHDAPVMAAATSAFADLHAGPPTPPPPVAAPPMAPMPTSAPQSPVPAAPQAFSAPPPAPAGLDPASYLAPDAAAAGVGAAFPPPAAPGAPAAFTPAGDPGAALVGGAAGTYPAPLPVPPGASWPQDEAPAPAAPSSALLAASEAAAAPVAPSAARQQRPRWVLPVAGVAVVAAAAGAYLTLGGSSSSGGSATPPVHHVARLTPGLLAGSVPAGFTMTAAPAPLGVANVPAALAPGHPVSGATAAEHVEVKNAKGATVSALAVQFPTPAAASAWVALKAPAPKDELVRYASRGVFAFAVTTTAPKDAAASAAVASWATALGA
jgi:hypothetical protein